MKLLLTCLLLSSALVAQVEPPKKKSGGEVKEASNKKKDSNTSKLRTWTDKQTKDAVKEFNETFKKRKASLRDQLRALEKLKEGRNALLVKPLAKVARKAKRDSVAKTAIQLLGNQPKKPVRKYLLQLMKSKTMEKRPVLMAELVRALGKESYVSRDWKDLEKTFVRLRDNPEKGNAVWEKAIVELVVKTKEKQALRAMLDSFDEPAPANVDSPTNPPREYWKARWDNWKVWKADAKEAMYQITGQRFEKRKEAVVWLRKNASKLGLKY